MSDFKERLKVEYQDLKEKTDKLTIWLCKEHKDLEPQYLYLMSLQKSIMEQYLRVLEIRAQVLNITLGDETK